MEFVRQLLCTGIDDQDCNGTQEEIPRMDQFFQKIESSFLVSICIAAIMTGIVLVFGILHWAFVLKFISNEQIRTDLYWLVFMGPVVSLCGLVGLIIPRAAIFLYAIALVYFMICIFVLVCIMTTLNGSRQAMCDKLIARGVKISLQVCPIGCCFCCFSKLEPNERTFRRIEWLVFQSPIVRIFLEILNIIVFMEINSRASLFFQISNLIGIISLFIGSYGSYMIIPAGSSLLSEYRFLLLFRLVDFSQLAWSVQKFVVEFLAFPRLHIFSSETILPPSAKAQFCISFLLCLEMLIVTLLATWLFRPSQTWFFDKFRHCSLGGGRSCRIGHSSFCADAKSVDFADLGRNGDRGPIHFYSQNGLDMANKFGESTLRLEQVRLNGSGHTVSTAADDAHSQQRRFSQGREYIVERENEGEEREEENQEGSSPRSESPKVPVEASQSTISVEEEEKGERERPKWTVKTD